MESMPFNKLFIPKLMIRSKKPTIAAFSSRFFSESFAARKHPTKDANASPAFPIKDAFSIGSVPFPIR